MSDPMTLFPAGLDLVTEQVDQTPEDAWISPSPCTEWRAIDVLAHVTGTVYKAIATLNGEDYEGAPAAAAGTAAVDEIVAGWRAAAASAADAILSADPEQVVDSPRGQLPLQQALALPVADLAVHSWDLAAATGRQLELSDELIEHVRGVVSSVPEEQLRSPSFFDPEVEAPADASPTDQLMAFLGRRRP